MNSHTGIIQFDTQFAFTIPADSRDAYFELVDSVSGYIRKYSGRYDEAIDSSSDPLVIFNLEYIPQYVWEYMITKLVKMGAIDVTQTLIGLELN